MKVSRHAKIVELIGQYDVETQEELAELLNREGFQVTQATVSRDIRELKLTKVAIGKEESRNILPFMMQDRRSDEEKYRRVLQRWCDFVHGYGTEYSGDQNSFRNGNGSCGCHWMPWIVREDCRQYCGG